MTSGRLVLIRHGESKSMATGVYGCHNTCQGLTDAGKAQATLLRDRLAATAELDDATVVLASVLRRALETAEIVAATLTGAPPVDARCGLCELHCGAADGLTPDARLARYGGPLDLLQDPDTPIAPGGESWRGFVDRAASTLRHIVEQHRDETTVAFTHSGVIGASAVAFGCVDATTLFTAPPPCTSLTEWRWRHGGTPRLFSYGDAGHLPAALRYRGIP